MSKQKTVLIVDDEVAFLESAEIALKGQYLCRTARSGEECLQEVDKEKPDLILLDVMMSDIFDGLETAKKLKSQPATKGIPIILLTSVNQSVDIRSQMDDANFPREKWLDKPVKADVIKAEVEKLIGK